jgi:hypothetical protein
MNSHDFGFHPALVIVITVGLSIICLLIGAAWAVLR